MKHRWSLCLIMPRIATILLEEAILVERGKSLLVICGEIYSRIPSLNAHYEKFNFTKNNIPESSLPRFNTLYENVEIHMITDDNAKRLILGTKTMSILFTSCTRLDINETPIIGPSSSNGFFPTRKTQIFIEKQKIKKIEAMVSQYNVDNSPPSNFFYTFDEHAQLRHLRSNFDRLSTYRCCRFSSKYTNSIHTRPLTIWTFCDRFIQVDADGCIIASSKLFKYIATQVFNKGSQATISKQMIISLQNEAKDSSKIKLIFKSILLLFGDDLNRVRLD